MAMHGRFEEAPTTAAGGVRVLLLFADDGKESAREVESFAKELRSRADATGAYFRRYGMSRESWHLKDTPDGCWVIGVTVFDDVVGAPARYAATDDGLDASFEERVLALSGVDLDERSLGPPTRFVFDWTDAARALGTLAPPA